MTFSPTESRTNLRSRKAYECARDCTSLTNDQESTKSPYLPIFEQTRTDTYTLERFSVTTKAYDSVGGRKKSHQIRQSTRVTRLAPSFQRAPEKFEAAKACVVARSVGWTYRVFRRRSSVELRRGRDTTTGCSITRGVGQLRAWGSRRREKRIAMLRELRA